MLNEIEDILEQIADGEYHPYPLDSWKRLLWSSEDGLGGFVNRLVSNGRTGASSQEVDQQELERCWSRIGGRAFLPSLQMLAHLHRWQVGPASPVQEIIDLERLAARIQSHFASSIAAHLSYRVLKGDAAAWKLLCVWVERATGGRIADEFAEPTWGRGRTEADVIQHALLGVQEQPNAYQSRTDGSHRIGQKLRTSLSANVLRQRRVPIVGVGSVADQEMDRWIGWLVLDLLSGDGGKLIEAPDLWNRPLGHNFLCAIRDAYEAAWPDANTRPSVRWSLDFPGLDGYKPLSDTSLGLAAHVGFQVLRDKRHYDEDCVFSARVEGGEIKTVSGLGKKWEALSRLKVPAAQGNQRNRFRWFGIAAEADDFTDSQLQERRANKVWITKIETIDQAVELATRTDMGIRQFLQAVKDYPDHGTDLDDQQKRFDKRPHYMPHNPSQLYVVPDVIIRPLDDVLEQQTRAAKQKKADGERSNPVQGLSAQDRDVTEEEFDSERDDVEQRNWAEICESAKQTPRLRGVILGSAGQGKSFLFDMTASRLAATTLRTLEDITSPVELAEVALPLLVSLPRVLALPQLVGQDSSRHVREAMVTALGERFGEPREETREETQRFLREQLLRKNVWTFLDGLDEVNPGSSDLRTLLQFTAIAEGPVFLAGRPYGLSDHRETIRVGWFGLALKSTGGISEDVKAYRLAPFDSYLVCDYTAKWFGGRNQVPVAFTNLLRTSPSVRDLTRIAYLLSLLCAVVGARDKEIDDDITRSDLYEFFLATMFECFGEERIVAWRHFLPRMAIRMIGRNEEAIRDPYIAGKAELIVWLEDKNNLQPPPSQHSDTLCDELTSRRIRMLTRRVKNGKPEWVFTHRSLVEFLAGMFLAGASDQDEGKGWETPLPRWTGPWLGGHTPKNVIDKLAWRSDWYEVIQFVAGKANFSKILLCTLAGLTEAGAPFEACVDDLSCHRLGLATQCLPEIRRNNRERSLSVIETITHRVMKCVEEAEKTESKAMFQHLLDAYPALSQGGFRDGSPFLDWLARQMESRKTIEYAYEVIKKLGETAGSNSILCRIAQLLRQDDYDSRTAARNMGSLGQAAAQHPDILPALAHMLRPGNFYRDQAAAAGAVAQIGEAAADYPGILNSLGRMHRYPFCFSDAFVAKHALLRMCWIVTKNPNYLAPLNESLRDGDSNQKLASAWTLVKLGDAAIQHSEILPMILKWLSHEDNELQLEATQMVAEIGVAATQNPEILPTLARLLRNGNLDQQLTTAIAIGKLGRVAAQHPDVLPILAELLQHTDDRARTQAAWAVAYIGDAAAQHSDILLALACMLRPSDDDDNEVASAVWAVEAIGAVAAQYTEIFSNLAPLLRSGHWERYIQRHHLWMRTQLAHPNPEILARLALLICHANDDQKLVAVWGLKKYGVTASQHPDILPALARLLLHSDNALVMRSAEAVAEFGVTAAQHPDILPALARLLLHSDAILNTAAASAVASIGGAAAQHRDILPALARLLHNGNDTQKESAIEAIASIGAAAIQHPKILSAISNLLWHGYNGQQQWSDRAVRVIGEAVVVSTSLLTSITTRYSVNTLPTRKQLSQLLSWLMGRSYRFFGDLHSQQWRIEHVESLSRL